MRLILFDLDGTLLTAGGIGRRSTRDALETVFGTCGKLDRFYPGGRTQEAIFADTLLDAGITTGEYLAGRDRLYRTFLASFERNLSLGEYQIEQLPGAAQLIHYLAQTGDYILGLVTGNHEMIARHKLRSAGLDPSAFVAGAYGQESADRSDLIPLGKRRAEEVSGFHFPGYHTIVVGDTTRDVKSALAAGATCFAVTSGTDSRDKLLESGPDSIFDHLGEVLERFMFRDQRTGGIDGI